MVRTIVFASGPELLSVGGGRVINTTGLSIRARPEANTEYATIDLAPLSSRGTPSSACAIAIPSTREAVTEISAMLLQSVIHNECFALAGELVDLNDARKQERLPALTLPPNVAEVIHSEISHLYRCRDLCEVLKAMTDEERAALAKAAGIHHADPESA